MGWSDHLGFGRCRRSPEICTCGKLLEVREVPPGLARLPFGCRSSSHPIRPEWPGFRSGQSSESAGGVAVIRVRGSGPGRMTWASGDRVERSVRVGPCDPSCRSKQVRAGPVRTRVRNPGDRAALSGPGL
jgi:hypothetical protein